MLSGVFYFFIGGVKSFFVRSGIWINFEFLINCVEFDINELKISVLKLKSGK